MTFKIKGYKGIISKLSLKETAKNVMMKINGSYIQSFKDMGEAMKYIDKYYNIIPQDHILTKKK